MKGLNKEKVLRFCSSAWLCLLTLITQGSIAAEAVHWEYTGKAGPEYWADLEDQYKICRTGRNQSPIDLATGFDLDLPQLTFDYRSQKKIRETNNGHSIQVDLEPGSYLTVKDRDRRFEAKQLHFHSPSEHTVAGQSFAMEVHIVHADKDGNLAVVGILFRSGAENPVLRQIWAFMPKDAGQTNEEAIPFEESGLLPPTREYYLYNGSLTTPPCSEGVTWVVLKNPIEASAAQIAQFQETIGSVTNRPIQPHNARTVLE